MTGVRRVLFRSLMLYTIREGARLVGVTEQILRLRILPEYAPHAPALLIPYDDSEPQKLYPESWMLAIRKLISSGGIELSRRSLTKPLMGARLCSPRHVWADQIRESQELRRVAPLDFVIW